VDEGLGEPLPYAEAGEEGISPMNESARTLDSKVTYPNSNEGQVLLPASEVCWQESKT